MLNFLLPIVLFLPNFLLRSSLVCANKDYEKFEKLLSSHNAELKALKQKYLEIEIGMSNKIHQLEENVKTQDLRIRRLETVEQETKTELEATVAKLQSEEEVIRKLKRECKELKSVTHNQQRQIEALLGRNKYSKHRNISENNLLMKLPSYENTAVKEKQERENSISRRSTNGLRAERLLSAVPTTQIGGSHAFYAYMSKDLPPPSPHHTFIYDHVITNIGGNYNQHSGMFTVPESGVYFFSATSITNLHSLIYFEIVKNSAPFATGLSNSSAVGNYHTGSILGIIYAEKGDVIFVRSQDPPPPSDSSPSSGIVKSRTWARTSFCGWRIQ